jgi:hypothetical protein
MIETRIEYAERRESKNHLRGGNIDIRHGQPRRLADKLK